MKWYAYHPADTLFLRGSEPMDSGTTFETVRIFPPSVSVISGAVRTTVLAQQQIPIREYKKGHAVSEIIGEFGGPAPFTVLGPLIKITDTFYVPAPGTWFTENKSTDPVIAVYEAAPLDEGIQERLGLGASSHLPGWVRHNNEARPLTGIWVTLAALFSGKLILENGRDILYSPASRTRLFSVEERTGIAMEKERNVTEGKIYTARHIRLNPEVCLVWGIDRPCGLAPEGVLSLGGEQRFGRYHEMDKPPGFPRAKKENFLALSPVAVSQESSKCLTASGKIIFRGGWDLARQFHKDMVPYYPAGAVFTNNAGGCCIPF